MTLFKLNAKTVPETGLLLDDLLKQMETQGEGNGFTLIVDGLTLGYVFAGNFEKKMIALGVRCRSVICCRVSPLQKAMVVDLARVGLGKMTLAIGDGANDVPMIMAAHVGVGIMGREGTQAVRSSDYSFAEFRFLKRLLVVHGRWSYLRLSEMILYSFYKNMAFITPQFIYGFYSFWNGQLLYEEFFMTWFNLFYTSLPPLLLGIFERDISDETAYKYPQLYFQCRDGVYWNWTLFLGVLVDSIWHSVVVFYGLFLVFGDSDIGPNGKVVGYWDLTFFSSNLIVAVVFAKLAVIQNIWNFLSWIMLLLSILVFIIGAIVIENIGYGSVPGTYAECYKLFDFWFSIPIIVAICVLPNVALISFRRMIWPSDGDIAVEMQKECSKTGVEVPELEMPPSKPSMQFQTPRTKETPELLAVLRSAYEAVSDAVIVVLPSNNKRGSAGATACDAKILLANTAAANLLGFNDHANPQPMMIEGISLRSILFQSATQSLPISTPPPSTSTRYPPLSISSIVDQFDGFTLRSVPSAGRTLKMKLRAKPAAGKSFEVDATVSQLTADALVNGGNAASPGSLPLVFMLKRVAVSVDAKNKSPSPELVESNLVFHSRYKEEFEEILCLGKGGFGVVFRAKNRLDGIEYAIKKVKLSCTPSQFSLFASSTKDTSSAAGSAKGSSFQGPSSTSGASVSLSDARLLNEVKLFARLSAHPNIIRYNAAWIEAEPERVIKPSASLSALPVSIPKANNARSLHVKTNPFSNESAARPGSVTSQLSMSLKSATFDSISPSRAPSEYVLFRHPSQLSINTASSTLGRQLSSMSKQLRSDSPFAEDDGDDMIEFCSNSSRATSDGSESSEDDSEDSDGEDLKRFVAVRSSAVNIAKGVGGLRGGERPLVSASLPIHVGRNVLSGERNGSSDVETVRVSRLIASRGRGSHLSLASGVSSILTEEDDALDLVTETSIESSETDDATDAQTERKQHKATLYIQMQLCPHMDLRTLINKRRNLHLSSPSKSTRTVIPIKTAEAHIFLVDDLESPYSTMSHAHSCLDDDEQEEDKTRTTNLFIFKQIVEGLLHIHELQVVHRDVKPDNIFVDGSHHVLIGDFGLAKSLAGHAISSEPSTSVSPGAEEAHNVVHPVDEETAASTDEGTFFYMAPELLDRQVYTSKSDVYSLGIILFELFHPFSTEMERIMTLTKLKKNPLQLGQLCASAGVPNDVSHMLSRLLSADPTARPSALEIILDPLFDPFTSHLTSHSPLSGSPAHSMNTFRRPSSSYTLRAPSVFSAENSYLRHRASSNTITIGTPVRSLGYSELSIPQSVPSFKFPLQNAHITVSQAFTGEDDEYDDESSGSSGGSGARRRGRPHLPHPSTSSSLPKKDPIEIIQLGESMHEGMDKVDDESGGGAGDAITGAASAKPVAKAFSHLWGMIKNVTKPKTGNTSPRLVDSPLPDNSETPAGPHHHMHSSKSSTSLSSSTYSVLSQKTLDRHASLAASALPESSLHPPALDGRSSSRHLALSSRFSEDSGAGSEGKEVRIMELENDVSVLLEQLVAMKEKNFEMEAALALKSTK
ncbi:hypothetical protein HDU98_007224 [Podochytrium sp. JEL0797]|nr:hypothetical protein HDU98_007224 [Podochytrium sp. JEL0797]